MLPDPRPTADKDAALVQAMFDRVAPRYDLANSLFSLGQDRHWRRVAAKAAAVRGGETVLDVAAGTGALAQELRAAGADIVALDFSLAMVATGAARDHGATGVARDRGAAGGAARDRGALYWANGDAMRLPFAAATFDVVTIAFGLRNLPDTAAGLAELARVTKPGGRLVVLEFSTPTWGPFRFVYRRYLARAIPAAARLVTSDPAAYRYLADSIVAWPDQESLARRIGANGWGRPRWRNLTGGIVAVHHAVRAS